MHRIFKNNSAWWRGTEPTVAIMTNTDMITSATGTHHSSTDHDWSLIYRPRYRETDAFQLHNYQVIEWLAPFELVGSV